MVFFIAIDQTGTFAVQHYFVVAQKLFAQKWSTPYKKLQSYLATFIMHHNVCFI